jgi:hypothetical protein
VSFHYETRGEPDNRSSVAATLSSYRIRPGIHRVPLSQFDATFRANFYSASDRKRVDALKARIEASGWVSPLIVVYDAEGPYVLEGAHRLVALGELGAADVPALIVDDLERENPSRILQAEIPNIPDDYAVQAKMDALTDDELLTDKHFRILDDMDAIRDRAIAVITAEQPFDGLVIPLRDHTSTFAIVAPFVKQKGIKAWQATNFDARGPWTDTVARTIPELLRDIYRHYKADFHKTKVVRKR